jgi:hypothetical protein
MVEDTTPVELGEIPTVEAVAPRTPIDFERVFEPIELFLLPWELKVESGNCEPREIDGNAKKNDDRSPYGAITQAILDHSTRLENP